MCQWSTAKIKENENDWKSEDKPAPSKLQHCQDRTEY